MLLYFYDEDVELTGVIDDFISLAFTQSFTGVGDWQLTIRENDLPIVRQSAYIKTEDGKSGVITKLKQQREADGNTIEVSGVELKGLAQKRVILPNSQDGTYTVTDEVPSNIIAQILYDSLTNASNPKRVIGGIITTETGTGETAINFEAKYDNAASAIQTLCETYGLGWNAEINNGVIEWRVFQGVNRTLGQTVNEPLILSFSDDTLTKERFEQAVNNNSNTAIVGGKGEGRGRTIITVNDENAGLYRNEVFVDARNDENGELQKTGKEKLAEYGTDTTITLEPSLFLADAFGRQFALGDYGTIRERGINLQLTEATETYERGQHKTQFTFGMDANTIQGALKRLTSNYNSVLAKESYGGGGSGAVDSVNGYTGTVVLDNTDVGAVGEPQQEGTNGQVLTTDGHGGRNWTTVQSGDVSYFRVVGGVLNMVYGS